GAQARHPDTSYVRAGDTLCVAGLSPSEIAVARANILNVHPGWRRADEAKLTWFFGLPGLASVIARIAPLAGLIETIAAAGSDLYGNVLLIAASANRCRRGSIVV